MPHGKKLIVHTLIYGVSHFGGRIIHYLLTPYYTTILHPKVYAQMAEFYAYAVILHMMYNLGLETVYYRFIKEKFSSEKNIYNSCISLLILSSGILSSVLIFFAPNIISFMGYNQASVIYIYLFAIILVIDTLMVIPFAKLKADGKALQFGKIGLFRATLSVCFNIFFLHFLHYAHKGSSYLWLQPLAKKIYFPHHQTGYIILSTLLGSSFTFALIRRSYYKVKFRLDWPLIKSFLLYGLPIMWMSLSGKFNEIFARSFIKFWLPQDLYPGQSLQNIFGVFSACFKVAAIMSIGIQAFKYAAEPFFFSSSKFKNAPERFSEVMYWFFLLGCTVLLSVSGQLELISFLFIRGAAYRAHAEVLEVIPFLLLGHLLLGIYYNLSVWFKLTDKTHYGLIINTLGASFALFINWMLVPFLGYWGNVWAAIISYVCMCALSFLWGKKHYPIPYQLIRMTKYLIITIILLLFMRNTSIENWFIKSLVNGITTILFIVILLYIERKKWMPLIKSFHHKKRIATNERN